MVDPIDVIDAAADKAVASVSRRVPEIIRRHMGRDMTYHAMRVEGGAGAGRASSEISSETYRETLKNLGII